MQFLGSCKICGENIPNYRCLGQHFRYRQDSAHQALAVAWNAWRHSYKAILRCRKCGDLFTITDKKCKDGKRCPRCIALRAGMSKRSYEALKFNPMEDTRQVVRSSKARWDGLSHRQISWTPGDALCQMVVSAWRDGDSVLDIRTKTTAPYYLQKQILEHAVGSAEYAAVTLSRKVELAKRMAQKAKAKFANMSDADKEIRWGKLRTGSSLEASLYSFLQDRGFQVRKNYWKVITVGLVRHPREADIKIDLCNGQSVVVLCDGEAFHGPKYIFRDKAARILNDVQTADGFYAFGYSVLRYSETEIRTGFAVLHLARCLAAIALGQRCYRTWHPVVERWETASARTSDG